MRLVGHSFAAIWAVDFEFVEVHGQVVQVLCMAALDLCSGRKIVLWEDELLSLRRAPFDTGESSLLVAYFASAEVRCFEVLGWPTPERILDLYVEFRAHTNGYTLPLGSGLVGACHYYGVDPIDAMRKDAMRALAMRGGSYDAEEREALMEYCSADVRATAALCAKMAPRIDPDRALVRGEYMRSVGAMEGVGIPLDAVAVEAFSEQRQEIQRRLIRELGFSAIFTDTTFSTTAFGSYLQALNIRSWPLTATGRLRLDDDTLRMMAIRYPALTTFRELRSTISQLRSTGLVVGSDGRNRALLSPFSSVTGRNQPSTTKFIFGCPSWMRGFIQPPPGKAIAYIDYGQQEFGIAAALSNDSAMRQAYDTGDPYLTFAKMARAVPSHATKKSHPRERELYKVCAGLAAMYGMSGRTLAEQLDVAPIVGEELLRTHRTLFPGYWMWSERAVDYAKLKHFLYTPLGWVVHTHAATRTTTLRNFPMQAAGADMLRVASILGHRAGIEICAPVHDALLIQADDTDIEDAVATMQRCMAEASEIVLAGFRLRTDVEVLIHHPQRWPVTKGLALWKIVANHIGVEP